MMINDGALIGRNHTDFIAGGPWSLPYEIRNESGDWTPYLPTFERQWNYKADSMSCVSFSCNNSLEMQHKQQTGNEINLSDRWLAKMSGTTKDGNYLYKVADTARNIGLVLESDYPCPSEPWTWDDYHGEILEPLLTDLKIKAGERRKNWDIAYEWIDLVPNELSKALKHAPVQLVYPNHAIAGVALKLEGNIVTYLDTYEPYIKTKPLSEFSDALKIVLTIKNMAQFKTQNYKGELRIVLQAATMEEWVALCKIYGLDPKTFTETVN